MKILFIAGHGEWHISNGYTYLPKGCSISFYTEFSKAMFSLDMVEILKGTYRGNIQQKIEQFNICPNYTIHPDPTKYLGCHEIINQRDTSSYHLIMNGDGPPMTLSSIFNSLTLNNIQLDMIFCTCRNTMLRDTGARSIGFNAAQGTWGDRDYNGRFTLTKNNPGDLFSFRLTNAFSHHLI